MKLQGAHINLGRILPGRLRSCRLRSAVPGSVRRSNHSVSGLGEAEQSTAAKRPWATNYGHVLFSISRKLAATGTDTVYILPLQCTALQNKIYGDASHCMHFSHACTVASIHICFSPPVSLISASANHCRRDAQLNATSISVAANMDAMISVSLPGVLSPFKSQLQKLPAFGKIGWLYR